MNSKRFGASVILFLGLGLLLSCSVFTPDTNLGKDIVKAVDSSAVDLEGGFAKLDSAFLPVSGARSVVVEGTDTGANLLRSGVHSSLIAAGRIGDDSVVAYKEFHVTNSVLATLRAACSLSTLDSVYLLLEYNPTVNDTTMRTLTDSMVTVSVYSCQRKYYPRVRNDYTAPDIALSSTVTFSRRKPDTTFYLPLGPDVVAQLAAAVADTATYKPRLAESDTLTGWFAADSARALRPDTVYLKDSVIQSFADTLINVTVSGLRGTLTGDTAVFGYTAGQTPVFDTVLFTRGIAGDSVVSQDSMSIVRYSVWRERTIRQRFVYDSAEKFIAALHLYASAGGGVVRFVGPPQFRIRYLNSSCDTAQSSKGSLTSSSLSYYFDFTSTEVHPIPPDSLVASWQADRFVEIPVDMRQLWSFGAGGGNGKTYSVIQNATCYLNATLASMERPGADTTSRKIVYGLLDHRITDSRAHSAGTYDSLLALLAAGRLANDSIVLDTVQSKVSSTISLPVTIFAQSMYEESRRPDTAYLYIFVRTVNDFARAVIRKPAAIKFSALFSNPQK